MVNGTLKNGAAAAKKNVRIRTAPSADGTLPKRSARLAEGGGSGSPSSSQVNNATPPPSSNGALGQKAEPLQRQKLMRFKKKKNNNNKKNVDENVAVADAKTGDCLTAKMAPAPTGKVSLVQAQLVSVRNGAVADKFNGKTTTTPPPQEQTKKIKVEIEFEDDTDESENENLRKVMAEIDKELMSAEEDAEKEGGGGGGGVKRQNSSDGEVQVKKPRIIVDGPKEVPRSKDSDDACLTKKVDEEKGTEAKTPPGKREQDVVACGEDLSEEIVADKERRESDSCEKRQKDDDKMDSMSTESSVVLEVSPPVSCVVKTEERPCKKKKKAAPKKEDEAGETPPSRGDEGESKDEAVAGDDKENATAKEKVYRMSKSELEMLVLSRVTEYFMDGNKSDTGALRRRCEHLEKVVEQWRRKANLYQKQLMDLQIVMQRAQLNKRVFAQPVRPPMRSVGLQVQLTRYIPMQNAVDVSKGAARGTVSSNAGAAKSIVIGSATAATTAAGHKLIVPKQSPGNGLAFVSSLGAAGSLSGGTFVGSKASAIAALARQPAPPQTLSTTSLASARQVVAKGTGNPLGISLLQPKSLGGASPQALTTSLVFSAPLAATGGSVTRTVTTTTSAAAAATLRPFIGAKGIVVTSNSMAPPVPISLVANQAARQQIATTTTTATTTSVKTSLVGQPQLAAVKFIDLTADDEEHNRNSLTVVPSLSTTTAVTVLTPSAASNQILTLNPSVVVSGGTTTPIRLATTPTSVRPGAAPPPIVSATAPMRLAYLVPSTSVVTMVRPNQPVFVAPTAAVQRPVAAAGARPPPTIPTIVLQRGTTLVPLQQSSQVTALQPGVRPPVIAPAPTTAATVIPIVTTTSQSVVSTVTATKTITATASVIHPAPLPVQPTYPDTPSSTRKAVPPKPTLKISKVPDGIVLSWNMNMTTAHAEVSSYQLFAYQESGTAPTTRLWKRVGEVKALPLPMACTLTQFVEGHKYYFAVRAIDMHKRIGPFSEPGSIFLVASGGVKHKT